MPEIVIKYGGSNLKDSTGLQTLHQLVLSYKQPVIIVVSALFGVTDFIIRNLSEVKRNKYAIQEAINYLEIKHFEFIKSAIIDKDIAELVQSMIQEKLSELERMFIGVNCIGEVPDFLNDQILCYGEKLSSIIVNSFLRYKGINCEEASPEEIGLITDGEFKNATVDINLSEKNVSTFFEKNKSYIIPGFYGLGLNKKITLLGRGGTDYSAACIARCINAKSLDIWKDVSGFLTGDPKFVQNPKKIEQLSYAEAGELAYFGAKILHPRTIEPLMDKNIPIRILDSRELETIPLPKSIITYQETISDNVIKSITFSDDFVVLKLLGPGVGTKPGVLALITSKLNDVGININCIITSQISINLIIASQDRQNAQKAIRDLNQQVIRDISILEMVSLIALVGYGMLEKTGIAGRIFNVLSNENINILLSSIGASEVVTYIIIDQHHRDKAMNKIHQEFFS